MRISDWSSDVCSSDLAVVTKGDRIAFVGDEAGARAAAGKDATIHDLHGATMLPGFVDAHSHFSAMMQMASGLDLDDPSLPPVTDIASLQAAIRGFIDARAISAGGWVVVWPYAEQKVDEKRNITRTEQIGRAHV